MAVLIERDVPCPMRDGCVLKADIWRPADDGGYPVLVLRTPYDKRQGGNVFQALDPVRMAEAGYVVVVQDARGRMASDGTHRPWIDEFDDGYDTVEWAARQPWSNGRVGIYGISYNGMAAWAAATGNPPGLGAVVATQSPHDHAAAFWRGGAFELGKYAFWTMRIIGPSELPRARRRQGRAQAEIVREVHDLLRRADRFEETLMQTVPVRSLPAAMGEPFFPYMVEVLDHPAADHYHAVRSIAGRHDQVMVPVLIIAGWNDVLLRSDLEHYASIRKNGGTPQAREDSRLVIGPWLHAAGLHSSAAGELDYGLRASGLAIDLVDDLTSYHRRWFDSWLKDIDGDDMPPVRLFVMGENRWRDEQEWPLARARTVEWHLQADGGFSPETPAEDAQPRAYAHDPADPCPTKGGALLLPPDYPRGPVPQDALLSRPDVLIFTSDILEEAMEVTGPVSAAIWASTSARDADWVVKLCDVHPDGRTFNVCDGIVRASRRDPGNADPQQLEPGEIERYEIDLVATSNVFLAGHRLRVLITSSDFPRYDRNPGTGVSSLDATTFEPATHRIFCDREHPSHLLLPIVPRP